MELSNSIFLGFIQGITEFLPISSSAHLILASKFLQWQDQGLAFDLAVHFGSLIAVIIYFKSYFINLIKGFIDLLSLKNTYNSIFTKKIILATIPIAFFGLLLKDFIAENARESLIIIAFNSIFWAILLYIADKRPEKINSDNKITYKHSIIMGIAQALAIIPGTSRSGSTITLARFFNISKSKSAEFSMVMSIPVILMMNFYYICSIINNDISLNVDIYFLLTGIISSFIFALITIHLLLKFVSKIGYTPFVIYRVLIGFAILLYIF